MAKLDATMLWLNSAPDRLALKRFTKEGAALGRKYIIELNGQWKDLDRILEGILSAGQSGYGLEDLFDDLPDLSDQVRNILIPSGIKAFARTPKLSSPGEGDKAELTIPFEEGLQEATGGAGYAAVGPNLSDEEAFGVNAGDAVPANTSYRLVFEPNDVELGYGLPFRKGYKWDLTTQAPNLDTYTFPNPPGYQNTSGGSTPVDAIATHPNTLIDALGYNATNISTLAICNIWREGAITEQQRGALFCYLQDGGGEVGTAASLGMQAYVLRILRGETSYRYFLPHVSVVRRYRSPPVVPGYFPLPGEIADAGEAGAPPAWCNAPLTMFASAPDPNGLLAYKYWSTGPQVEFVGDQWQVEVQWNGFVDMDMNLYLAPTGEGTKID